MLQAGSLPWFAAHEFRLQWRDLTVMLTAGAPRRAVAILAVSLVFFTGMHWIASVLIGNWAKAGIEVDTATLAQLTGSGLLFATMSLSQAMESVTRAYYSRADLDLILSSPASARALFIVRTGTIAVTSMLLMAAIMSPFVNMLVVYDGWKWLAIYPVVAAISVFTTALAILITLALFRIAGPKRTRIIAQVLAAIVGAALIVGIQIAVIFSTGTTSNAGAALSGAIMGLAPDVHSWIWTPARAATGDFAAMATTIIVAAAAIILTLALAAPGFARLALAANAIGQTRAATKHAPKFRNASQAQMLRTKEWLLLIRDPWLMSQSLMQLLYLLPPAVLLWLNYGNSGGTLPIVAAIITMAAAQLAGGLAWLTLSGEDAHDLILTAPLRARDMLRAKIEAVLIAIGVIISPFVIAIAFIDLRIALTLFAGVAFATASSVIIQLMFRVRAKRSQFARRQTASRIATLLEAFVSITWAGATGLSVALPLAGPFAALPAVLIVFVVWLLRRKAQLA
ncbi:MAG: permease [Hyphomicrobiaceae bacterium]|nr:permease [Hyphomicrobiaceae bacterium]MCC0024749.1 permease [Hyphomicrobiaceae bacterium]